MKGLNLQLVCLLKVTVGYNILIIFQRWRGFEQLIYRISRPTVWHHHLLLPYLCDRTYLLLVEAI